MPSHTGAGGKMAESVDVYADQFQVNIGPWGATLNFNLSSNSLPAPGAQPQTDRVATVRTSLQHLKVMTMILRRHISNWENDQGVRIDVPTQVLSAMGIALEDWDVFWKRDR